MPAPADGIESGHYARKQLFGGAWLITWSHRRRFRLACQLATRFQSKRVLDYGCGDGTFLAMLSDLPERPAKAVGAEVHSELVKDCTARFASRAGISFVTIADLDQPGKGGVFDAIFCMEVLEHVVKRELIYDLWDRILAPGGELIISVPNETGPALAIKQPARRIARYYGMKDYPGSAPYTWGELIRSVFAGRSQHIVRSVYRETDGAESYCHKGFNWRALRQELMQRWELLSLYKSPVPFLPVDFNSQVWFHLRKRGVN